MKVLDWEFIWRSIKFFFKSIVEWADLHYGFLMVILTAITAIILILYTTSTWKMSKSTNKSVKVAEKSIRLTKDKEKIDRTLEYIEKFDLVRYSKLWRKKEDYQNKAKQLGLKENCTITDVYPDAAVEMKFFLHYFDTIATLYYQKEFNKGIFEWKIELYFKDFICTFQEEILNNISNFQISYCVERGFYFFENFLDLCIKILEKTINSIKDKELISLYKEIQKKYKSKLLQYK